MNIGAFSVSLAVKDLASSKEFYQKLGFTVFAGEEEHNYLIMKNGQTLIGLFEGMFSDNILTFNPGWDQDNNTLSEFADIREVNKRIRAAGLITEQESLDGESGPGSFVIIDPDGNPILFDQHI